MAKPQSYWRWLGHRLRLSQPGRVFFTVALCGVAGIVVARAHGDREWRLWWCSLLLVGVVTLDAVGRESSLLFAVSSWTVGSGVIPEHSRRRGFSQAPGIRRSFDRRRPLRVRPHRLSRSTELRARPLVIPSDGGRIRLWTNVRLKLALSSVRCARLAAVLLTGCGGSDDCTKVEASLRQHLGSFNPEDLSFPIGAARRGRRTRAARIGVTTKSGQGYEFHNAGRYSQRDSRCGRASSHSGTASRCQRTSL